MFVHWTASLIWALWGAIGTFIHFLTPLCIGWIVLLAITSWPWNRSENPRKDGGKAG
jgi:hypothetical protein